MASYSTTSYGGTSAPSFNSAAYGGRPAPTAIPKSLWEEGAAANPGLYALNDSSNALVKNQLAGVLSPETLNSIRDNSATFGVTSGMPGAGLAGYRGLRDIGRNVQDLQNQGFQNYMGALKTTASQQLDPSLVANIEMHNADLAAAPDPAAAAAQENSLYQYRYNQQRQQQLEDEARAENLWQSHYALTNAPASTNSNWYSGRKPKASGYISAGPTPFIDF